jgi:hypothetical protein
MLLRAVMPTQVTIKEKQEIIYESADQVRAKLNRAGIPIDKLFELEYIKQPVVDVEAAMDATDDDAEAHGTLKDDERR